MKLVPEHAWTKTELQFLKTAWSDEHGRRAINVIVDSLCRLTGSAMVIGDSHMSAHLEGRRWVAQQIATAVNTPIEKLLKEDPNEPARVLTATERLARDSIERARRGD